MRKRVICNGKKDFSNVKNPCHKVLCEIIAGDVKEVADEILVREPELLVIKCSSCRDKTKITFEGE